MFEAVRAHLARFDDVHTEAVAVGVFFKRSRVFAQLRPMRRWVALGILLPRKLDSPRLERKVTGGGSRYFHTVNLTSPGDLDATVRGWLDEAYRSAG